MNTRFLFVALALALAALAPAAGGAQSPAPQPAARWQADSPLGVGGYSFSHNALRPRENVMADAHKQLTLHNLSGAAWARQDFWWSVANPREGEWDWALFDAAMASYRERGIRLLAILCYGSPWASGGDAPSDDAAREAFGEFVFRMVERYKDSVGAWEIWNEPDILPFWSPRPGAADYTALLKVAHRRAREADPGAVIVAGALALPTEDFLREMYANGAKGAFDILSFHGYGQASGDFDYAVIARRLREEMRRHGDDKPIWLTETGVYTGPAGVSDAEQAAALARITLATIGSSEVEKIFQLTLRDWSDDPAVVDATSFRGLLRASGEPKPSFYTHRRLADALRGKKGLGRLYLAGGLPACAFGDPKHPLLAVWADAPATKTLAVEVQPFSLRLDATHIAVTELETGETRLVAGENGAFTLPIGRFPQLIEGAGRAIGIPAMIHVTPEPVECVAGGRSAFQIELRNADLLDGMGLSANLPLPEAGWSIENAAFSLSKSSSIATCHIWAPMDSTVHSLALNLFSSLPAPLAGTTDCVRRIPLKTLPPFEMTLGSLSYLNPREPAWPLHLKNRLAEPLQISIKTRMSIYSGDSSPSFSRDVSQNLELPGAQRLEVALPLRRPWGEDVRHSIKLDVTANAGSHSATDQKEFVIQEIRRLSSPPVIDGDLVEWIDKQPTMTDLVPELFNPALYGGESDLSGAAWIAWDADFFYFALLAKDDRQEFSQAPTVWDFDSLQMGFDFGADTPAQKGYDDLNDMELEVARMRDGSIFLAGMPYPSGRPVEPLIEGARVAIRPMPESGEIAYEIALPWATLPLPAPPREGTLFAFNFILNDNDGAGRRGWLEWTPGIGWGKEPSRFTRLWLLDTWGRLEPR